MKVIEMLDKMATGEISTINIIIEKEVNENGVMD